MIDATVQHGIRDMAQDPARSVRRLADLGKHFSRGRFQDTVFTIMQELLENEQSAYYDMVANVLRNVDHDAVRTFGVNVGYMSWTYGARLIRGYEQQTGRAVPAQIMLRYDCDREDGLSVAVIDRLITEGERLGIYAWHIRQLPHPDDNYALLDLFSRHKESAFLWLRPSGRLTAAQIQMLRNCPNTCIVMPAGDPESLMTAAMLRDHRILYAMYAAYDGAAPETDTIALERTLTSETPLFFTVAEDGSDASMAEYCQQTRLSQKYPCFLLDYYDDMSSIDRLAVDHPYILEIGPDAGVLRLTASGGAAGTDTPGGTAARFPLDVPLTEALDAVMPAMPR